MRQEFHTIKVPEFRHLGVQRADESERRASGEYQLADLLVFGVRGHGLWHRQPDPRRWDLWDLMLFSGSVLFVGTTITEAIGTK